MNEQAALTLVESEILARLTTDMEFVIVIGVVLIAFIAICHIWDSELLEPVFKLIMLAIGIVAIVVGVYRREMVIRYPSTTILQYYEDIKHTQVIIRR